MPGTLYVVATPIGNLEDLTFRALRTLREVDLIAAEDTRRTAKLLAHYAISKPVVSLREHNEASEGARLVAKLRDGAHVALVSDAGTPGIADPGARFVRMCRDAGIPVSPIPGPSALTAALSVSGLDITEVIFLGFVPANSSERTAWLQDLASEPRALVMFESTHRAEASLNDISSTLVNRPIQVWRELTKLNEQLVEYHNRSVDCHGNLAIDWRGEFVIVVGPLAKVRRAVADESMLATANDLFCYLTNRSDIDDKIAYRTIAEVLQVPVSSAVSYVKKGRILAKRHNSHPER